MLNKLLESNISLTTLFRIFLTILTLSTLPFKALELSILNFFLAFLVFFSLFLKFDDKWSVLAILFLGAYNLFDIFSNYLTVSNHHFLMFYLSIIFVIGLFFKEEERKQFIEKQLFIVFGLVMLLSGLQKIISPDFSSGNFMGFLFYSGGFSKFWSFIEPMNNFTQGNQELLKHISVLDPLQKSEFAYMNYSKNHVFWIKTTSWIVILSEIAIGVMTLTIPKQYLFYVSSLMLMIGITFTRLETGFISILSILLLLIIPHQFKQMKLAFILLFCVSLSLIFVGIGVF